MILLSKARSGQWVKTTDLRAADSRSPWERSSKRNASDDRLSANQIVIKDVDLRKQLS
ncbi:hypothetical protein [Neorhodopirellula lusitana]|uniref:hypothetical protein n=1 Tax=Neorhodopirellula lusitana TaxID=445327 RepID=UPI00384C052F